MPSRERVAPAAIRRTVFYESRVGFAIVDRVSSSLVGGSEGSLVTVFSVTEAETALRSRETSRGSGPACKRADERYRVGPEANANGTIVYRRIRDRQGPEYPGPELTGSREAIGKSCALGRRSDR